MPDSEAVKSSEYAAQSMSHNTQPTPGGRGAKDGESSLQDQSSRMPLKKILIVYFGIGQ